MATQRGFKGAVKLGANTVAHVQEWSLDISRDEDEVSGLGAKTKKVQFEQIDYTGRVRVKFDYGDTNGQKALLDEALAETPSGVSADLETEDGTSFTGTTGVSNVQITNQKGRAPEATFTIRPFSGDLAVA